MATYTPEQLQSIAYQQQHPNDDTRYQLVVVTTVCPPIAAIAVAARVWARMYSRAGLGPDDWTTIAALIVYIVYAINTGLTAKYGMGKHLIYVTDPWGLGVTTIIAETAYNVFVGLIKISVLLFYRRLFPQKSFRVYLWATGLLILAFSVAQLLGTLLHCIPIQKIWLPNIPGTCIDFSAKVLFGSVFNVITDVVTLVLPVPIIWHLKLEKKRRMALIFTFTVGGLASIVSIMLAIYTKNLAGFDDTWSYVPAIIITTIECLMFTISVCIPTYAPFFTRRRAGCPLTYNNTGALQLTPMSPSNSRREIWSALDSKSSAEDGNKVTVTTHIDTSYEDRRTEDEATPAF